MRRVLLLVLLLPIIIIFFSGCNTKLPDEYYKVDLSFKGQNLEYSYNGGVSFNNTVDHMVYTVLPKALKEDLENKGNKIDSIACHGAKGEEYGEGDTVALMDIEINSESGDVKSGEYTVAALFTYEGKDENTTIYFVNYAFVEDKKDFNNNNGADIFSDAVKSVSK